MIQIFEITAPVPQGADGAAMAAIITKAMSHIKRAFTPLLAATVEASETALTLRLRVFGRDRWNTSHRARQIGSAMLRRLDIDAATAAMVLIETSQGAKSLTKAQGRSVTNHRSRGSAKVKSSGAPENLS